MKNIKINSKIIISIFIVIIIVLIIAYVGIFNNKIKKGQFVENMIELSTKNEEPIFTIKRLELFSSANVIDNSIEKNLQNLDIYQYADISIHINNRNTIKELTKRNTIKELYIDNITLETNSQIGERSLNYTNLLNFAKDTGIDNNINTDRIDFNIVYTNEENDNADYSNPTFYTDCSNPITLKYLNNNIVKGFKVGEGKKLSFDGKLLKEANVSRQDISCKIKFKINIVNNVDERFSCWINFDIPINELYTKGKTKKIAENINYDFFAM